MTEVKPELAQTQKHIREVCEDMADLLIQKNNSYGNSALDPQRIFARASTKEQLYVRIDDKLNRIMRGHSYPGDNDIDDLLGYLILVKVYERLNNGNEEDREEGSQEIPGQQVLPGTEEGYLGYTEQNARAVRRALSAAYDDPEGWSKYAAEEARQASGIEEQEYFTERAAGGGKHRGLSDEVYKKVGEVFASVFYTDKQRGEGQDIPEHRLPEVVDQGEKAWGIKDTRTFRAGHGVHVIGPEDRISWI
jgi:hypothetical protein